MSTMQRINEDSRRDPDTLEREAEAARRDIQHTMDLLEQRLSPGQLLDRALAMGREQGGEFAANLGRQLKYHPIPLLLTAVGISWLALAENRPVPSGNGGVSAGDGSVADSARRLGDKARGKLGDMTGNVSGTLQSASERMHQSADSLRARAAGGAESMRHQRERARQYFEQTLHEQPLVLGALGLALGAVVGGMLPRSRYEDRAIGQYGERLREQARSTAEEAKQVGARAADAARESATRTARDEASSH